MRRKHDTKNDVNIFSRPRINVGYKRGQDTWLPRKVNNSPFLKNDRPKYTAESKKHQVHQGRLIEKIWCTVQMQKS